MRFCCRKESVCMERTRISKMNKIILEIFIIKMITFRVGTLIRRHILLYLSLEKIKKSIKFTKFVWNSKYFVGFRNVVYFTSLSAVEAVRCFMNFNIHNMEYYNPRYNLPILIVWIMNTTFLKDCRVDSPTSCFFLRKISHLCKISISS